MRIDDQTTVADYLVLGTWEALTLLSEARELCDSDDVAQLLAKAEEILTSVVSELPGALPRAAGRTIRHNGGAFFDPPTTGSGQAQAPFEYRPPDHGSRDP